MIVTATEIKNSFGKYLKSVSEDGDEIIITKNNEKVARLVPYITDIAKYFTISDNAINYQFEHKKVSYDEFLEIYKKSDRRMEFINGEVFLLTSPNIFHQDLLGNLHVLFKEHFKGKKCRPYMAPFDVHFKKQNIKDPDVMQPDLVVLCDYEGNITDKGRYTGTPELTLEILSDSTRTKDTVYKLNTFMTSGVSEYWMVDPENTSITVYYFKNHNVDMMKVFKTGETAVSEVFKNFKVSVNEVFDSIKSIAK